MATYWISSKSMLKFVRKWTYTTVTLQKGQDHPNWNVKLCGIYHQTKFARNRSANVLSDYKPTLKVFLNEFKFDLKYSSLSWILNQQHEMSMTMTMRFITLSSLNSIVLPFKLIESFVYWVHCPAWCSAVGSVEGISPLESSMVLT